MTDQERREGIQVNRAIMNALQDLSAAGNSMASQVVIVSLCEIDGLLNGVIVSQTDAIARERMLSAYRVSEGIS